MDVPTAVLSGLGQQGPGFAALLGSTRPFDAAHLARLYPRGRADYLPRFEKALQRAVDAGFILPDDAPEIRALAAAMYPRIAVNEPSGYGVGRASESTTSR